MDLIPPKVKSKKNDNGEEKQFVNDEKFMDISEIYFM